MAKMLEWAPHSLGLQNIQCILKWTCRNSTLMNVHENGAVEEESAEENESLPMLLPAEFVESLRLRVKETRSQTTCDATDMSSIVERMRAAGIEINSTDIFNN